MNNYAWKTHMTIYNLYEGIDWKRVVILDQSCIDGSSKQENKSILDA